MSEQQEIQCEAQYEFDVAVSFAGEDRDYVQEVVEGVKAAAFRAFYDDDHVAEMWGEDGVEYLTDVYQRRARYVIMFVSQHYAEKMWTRLERRAALARAMTEKRAYVLPVRLDSTHLDGLLPSVIYVDANRVGLSGLVELIKAKLTGTTPAGAPSELLNGKVPRTQKAIEAMIEERPRGWEYLLYAAMIRQGVNALDAKHRDHLMEYGAPTGIYLDRTTILDFGRAGLAEVQSISENFGIVLDPAAQERAFGAPGEPGDVDRVLHLAERFVSVYEDFMDWSAKLRGASVTNEHGRTALRLLARAADQPVEEMRKCADTLVAECDAMLERLDRGEIVHIELSVVLEVEDGLMDRYVEEMRLAVEEDD